MLDICVRIVLRTFWYCLALLLLDKVHDVDALGADADDHWHDGSECAQLDRTDLQLLNPHLLTRDVAVERLRLQGSISKFATYYVRPA